MMGKKLLPKTIKCLILLCLIVVNPGVGRSEYAIPTSKSTSARTFLVRSIEFERRFYTHFVDLQMEMYSNIPGFYFESPKALSTTFEANIIAMRESLGFFLDLVLDSQKSFPTQDLPSSNDIWEAYQIFKEDEVSLKESSSIYTQLYMQDVDQNFESWTKRVESMLEQKLYGLVKLKEDERIQILKRQDSIFFLTPDFLNQWAKVEPNQSSNVEAEWILNVFGHIASDSTHNPVVQLSGHKSGGARKFSGVCGESTKNNKACRVITKCFQFSKLHESKFCVPLKIYKKGNQKDLSPQEIDEIAAAVKKWERILKKTLSIQPDAGAGQSVNSSLKKALAKIIEVFGLSEEGTKFSFESEQYVKIHQLKDEILKFKGKLLNRLISKTFEEKMELAEIDRHIQLIDEMEVALQDFREQYRNDSQSFVKALSLAK